MSYKNRIAFLTETMKVNAEKIAQLKSQVGTDEQVARLITDNVALGKEVSRLHKLDFEESYERINLDDDR